VYNRYAIPYHVSKLSACKNFFPVLMITFKNGLNKIHTAVTARRISIIFELILVTRAVLSE